MHTVCFADDTLVIVQASSVISIQIRTNTALSNILNFLSTSHLNLNVNKTQSILFHNLLNLPSDMFDPLIFQINDTPLILSQQITYLGVILDTKLSFIPHIQHLISKSTNSSKHCRDCLAIPADTLPGLAESCLRQWLPLNSITVPPSFIINSF